MSIATALSPQAHHHSIALARGSPQACSSSFSRTTAGFPNSDSLTGFPFCSMASSILRPKLGTRRRSRDILTNAVAVSPAVAQAASETSSADGGGDDIDWLGLRRDFNYNFLINEYKILGQGSFGIVHEGVDLMSGDAVAIKIMPKSRPNVLKEGNLGKLLREISMLRKMQGCPNVVQLYGCFEDKENVQICMELCTGMDLQKVVESHGPLSERSLALVAYQIAKIIQAFHEKGIIHADVKPANFSLAHPLYNPLFSTEVSEYAKTPWLKALDFGCSREIPEGQDRLYSRAGTPAFIAPEVFARNYSLGADMWSLGVTLYWMYSECFPFFPEEAARAAKLDDVIDAVLNAPIPYDTGRWLYMSPAGLDFIQRCLERDEDKRLTAEEALSHPWFHPRKAAPS